LRVSTSNRSVHFYPVFKAILSLPVTLCPHDLQQHDQFLALKVSRSPQKSLSKSATRVNYKLAMFFSSAVHATSAACVCKSASNCVLSTNLKNVPEKLDSGPQKCCEGLCGPRKKSLSNCSLQIQQQA